MIFTKTFFSPFKPLKWKWYFGKVKIGVPYFLPRKWVRFTYEDALKKTEEQTENNFSTHFGKNPKEIVSNYLNYSKAVEKKIGFDFRDLGWKTKWTSTDYRFESSPVFSFVFFGWQFAITFVAPEIHNYWEAFLYYHYNTDKTKSTKERVKQCREEHPQTYIRYSKDKEEKVDYYQLILKKKFL